MSLTLNIVYTSVALLTHFSNMYYKVIGPNLQNCPKLPHIHAGLQCNAKCEKLTAVNDYCDIQTNSKPRTQTLLSKTKL